MIKNCFIDDDQPKFYKEVKLDGVKIANIHALTRNDEAAIEEAAYRKRIIGGELNLDINSQALVVTRMFRSLTGEKEAGWELGRDVTIDNIGKLDKKTFKAINDAILELQDQNLVTEDIAKN